ncbi:nuclear transport factor 2 family protein [Sphingobium sufflavum]|uniref:nuclear transport factor 2 family protein n=1 Tax=Sphingobium sufflavum TaxID=1129547 RepID=UPI001F29B915|nr:nuclear transport factor 2 family protein [Sphingobium sufflavum]MCE7798878.1 nuclear transport factor 2 family protein [Sphingobium sufflavum]
MSVDLEKLAQDVAYLKDRLAIEDCVNQHARGHDRFDVEMMTDCYHEDGVDEHGAAAINKGPDYGEWANKVHGQGALLNLHNITTHTCEIDGDTAHAESYVLVGLLNPDGVSVRFINGRYVDRLEKRNGVWRIALRRCTLDLLITGDASLLKSPYISAAGYIKGQRNKTDVSYQRPLSLENDVERL